MSFEINENGNEREMNKLEKADIHKFKEEIIEGWVQSLKKMGSKESYEAAIDNTKNKEMLYEFLNKRRLGRLLVKIYYKISPRLILTFGSIKLIKNINRKILDKIVRKLNGRGYVNSKYIDQ